MDAVGSYVHAKRDLYRVGDGGNGDGGVGGAVDSAAATAAAGVTAAPNGAVMGV